MWWLLGDVRTWKDHMKWTCALNARDSVDTFLFINEYSEAAADETVTVWTAAVVLCVKTCSDPRRWSPVVDLDPLAALRSFQSFLCSFFWFYFFFFDLKHMFSSAFSAQNDFFTSGIFFLLLLTRWSRISDGRPIGRHWEWKLIYLRNERRQSLERNKFIRIMDDNKGPCTLFVDLLCIDRYVLLCENVCMYCICLSKYVYACVWICMYVMYIIYNCDGPL